VQGNTSKAAEEATQGPHIMKDLAGRGGGVGLGAGDRVMGPLGALCGEFAVGTAKCWSCWRCLMLQRR
jgi:hypothetical protein